MSPRTARTDTFAAIADPNRRAMLDLLLARPERNVGDIATAFPKISRAAVSKHLGVLRRAKLVRSRKRGREQYYELNPQPLVDIHDGWLRKFEEIAEASLQRLKERVENEEA